MPNKPRRRSFKAEEKVRIVTEYDAASSPEQRAAIMRREGVYASHLSKWRHLIKGSTPPKRGRPADTQAREIERLQRELSKHKKRADRAEDMLETMGKVHALLQKAASKSAADKQH